LPYEIFTWLMSLATLAMLVMLVHRLLAGYWREYRLLTVMVAVSLLCSAPPLISYATEGALWALPNAKLAYWTLALSFQVLVFAVILQLLWRVGASFPGRAQRVRMLSAVAALAGGGVVVLHAGNKINVLMALVSRDLTFVAAIFAMLLWTLLLQVRKRDRTLLFVCMGIGIQSASDAFSHSLRLIGKDYQQAGNICFMVGSALSAYVLMQAFRKPYRVVERRNLEAEESPIEPFHNERASIH
jgi:hypothetical protein